MKRKIYEYIVLVLSGVLLAFGLYNVHSVTDITEGGILGFALLLDYWFKISPAITNFILNAICYLFGFKILGKDFIVRSFFCTIGFSLSYKIFEITYQPLFGVLYNYPLLASIIGALFVGVSIGICVMYGGAPTGDDALAMGLTKIIKIKIQWVYLISDLLVLCLSLTYIPFSRIVYSLVTVILSGQTIGLILKLQSIYKERKKKKLEEIERRLS